MELQGIVRKIIGLIFEEESRAGSTVFNFIKKKLSISSVCVFFLNSKIQQKYNERKIWANHLLASLGEAL